MEWNEGMTRQELKEFHAWYWESVKQWSRLSTLTRTIEPESFSVFVDRLADDVERMRIRAS